MRTVAKICFTSDDNHETIYTKMFPKMRQLGMVGSVAIITKNIASTDGTGLLSRTQLQEMYDTGWTIASHTYQHVHLTEEPDENVIWQVSHSRDILISEGWERGSDILIPPYNEIDDRVLSLISSYVKLTTVNYVSYAAESLNAEPLSKYHIVRHSIGSNTVADVKSWVDAVVADSGYMFLYLHGIGEPIGYLYPEDMFNEVIEYVAELRDSGDIEVVSLYDTMVEANTSTLTIKGSIS